MSEVGVVHELPAFGSHLITWKPRGAIVRGRRNLDKPLWIDLVDEPGHLPLAAHGDTKLTERLLATV